MSIFPAAVSFYETKNCQVSDLCGICKDPLSTGTVIAHNNGGEKHPLHKRCLIDWSKFNPSCPCCRAPIDADSLLSWKDKFIQRITEINNRIIQDRAFKKFFIQAIVGEAIGGAIVEGFAAITSENTHTVSIIGKTVLGMLIGASTVAFCSTGIVIGRAIGNERSRGVFGVLGGVVAKRNVL